MLSILHDPLVTLKAEKSGSTQLHHSGGASYHRFLTATSKATTTSGNSEVTPAEPTIETERSGAMFYVTPGNVLC